MNDTEKFSQDLWEIVEKHKHLGSRQLTGTMLQYALSLAYDNAPSHLDAVWLINDVHSFVIENIKGKNEDGGEE